MMASRILFALSLLSATAIQEPKEPAGRMRITLSVYSGLKDPTWSLSEAQDKRFIACFDALTTGEPKKQLKPQLGYRGFEVAGFRDYDELTVWNNIVEASRGGKTYRWHDKDRGLERYLLETSKGHIAEGVYKIVASEVEKD